MNTYELDVNTVNEELMIVKLNMSEDEARFLLNYRNKFKILDGDNTALVNLEELWEALDKPYGQYPQWKSDFASHEVESGFSDLTIKPRKNSKGGRPKVVSYITTEDAKGLAMLSRTEAGRTARKYFITIEKLFKQVCEYNNLRVNIEQTAKNVSHNGFKTGGKWKGINDKKRFNTLMSKISGKRNELNTNLDEYNLVSRQVEL
ncbi:antA/AntB antirepressor family protein [Scandinavium sp. H11S7]|uniref:antA/AntB antirepressor family protein n=1 Tax=Scandinavium hiltneri TaxID=2926519 RepID=UPI002165A9ED|nr:antA/AntB antirepressor family protein [Scandinavium hiltneri]MCS2155416.1 antA/AntB antirepressor family protein [Scandinavium hiltneri]